MCLGWGGRCVEGDQAIYTYYSLNDQRCSETHEE